MSNSIYNKTKIAATPQAVAPEPHTYRGFSTVSPDTENHVLYDYALIKQDILNHFYTRQGERLMNPRFGTVIWALLFEPLTEQVKDAIVQNVNEILNYDPRVQAGNVVVTSYDTGIQVECTLKYMPYNIQERLKMKFDQANGLVTQ